MLPTIRPTLKSILSGSSEVADKYIPDLEYLEEMVALLRKGGYRISLTQGVYDWLHVAHLRYLKMAKSFGDVLVLGIDDDELVRATKGKKDPLRPYDPFDYRIEILASMGFINVLVKRDLSQQQYDLIKVVKPDVLIMSKSTSSFTDKDIKALSEFCGQIEHLEPLIPSDELSTTMKVRKMVTVGKVELANELDEDFRTLRMQFNNFVEKMETRFKALFQGEDGGPNGTR